MPWEEEFCDKIKMEKYKSHDLSKKAYLLKRTYKFHNFCKRLRDIPLIREKDLGMVEVTRYDLERVFHYLDVTVTFNHLPKEDAEADGEYFRRKSRVDMVARTPEQIEEAKQGLEKLTGATFEDITIHEDSDLVEERRAKWKK